MFEVEKFIADCEAAVAADPSHKVFAKSSQRRFRTRLRSYAAWESRQKAMFKKFITRTRSQSSMSSGHHG